MDKEAEKLFAPIDTDELSSASDVAKEFNKRLEGIQKWVDQQIDKKTSAVKKETQDTIEAAETKKIVEFAKSHPELKTGSEVAAMMEQLYTTNTDLEDIYKKSCVACGLKPVAIDKEGKTVNLSTGNVVDKDGKEVEKKQKAKAKDGDSDFISSLKSDEHNADADDVDEGGLKKEKDTSNMSVREIAAANWNEALADAGVDDVPE